MAMFHRYYALAVENVVHRFCAYSSYTMFLCASDSVRECLGSAVQWESKTRQKDKHSVSVSVCV